MDLPSFEKFLEDVGPDYLKDVADKFSDRVTGLYIGNPAQQLSEIATQIAAFSLKSTLKIVNDYHEWLRQSLR